MIPRFFIALFLIFQTAGNSYAQNTRTDAAIDTSLITILPCYLVDPDIFPNCNSAALTDQDMRTIDSLLIEFVSRYNAEQSRQFYLFPPEVRAGKTLLLLDLKRFKRQYVATINETGVKLVWINAFCNPQDKNWRKEIIRSGGERMCNFKIRVDLANKRCFDFRLLPVKDSI